MRTSDSSAAGVDTGLLALAAIYAIGGAASGLGVWLPATADTSTATQAIAGGIGVSCAIALLALARAHRLARHRVVALHIGLAFCALVTGALMMLAVHGSGEVLIGFNTVYLAMTAAYFLPRRPARLHVAHIVLILNFASLLSPVTDNRYVGPVLSASVIAVFEVLGRLVARLRDSATTDDLTGALNRAALREVGRQVLADAARHDQPVSLVVIDLDGFKSINDRDGHLAGDHVLASVAEAWRTTLRSSDVLARIGGDEFVVLLPSTDRAQALAAVSRLRAAHSAAWSAGLATGSTGADLAALFDQADQDLYRHKSARRSSSDAAQVGAPVASS